MRARKVQFLLLPVLLSLNLLGFPFPDKNTPSSTSHRGTLKPLTSRFGKAFLRSCLLPTSKWKPFPKAEDRKAWKNLLKHPLNRRRMQYLVEKAERLLNSTWPSLPATLYMEFARTGNRSNYERVYFKKRLDLATLVLAECFEYRGRFMDQIANGIISICEESTWCLPAHARRYPGDPLHRPDIQSLDLFACETGATLSLVRYLLGKKLRELSRSLYERIGLEVSKRILDPYRSGDNFGCSWWTRGHNNWAPWCATNVLASFLMLGTDLEKLVPVVYRLMQVIDRFVDGYGEDGGCDEGPSYWNQAGGSLLFFLELICSRTDGKVAIWDLPKIRAIGRYIYKAHLTGPYFANFADADAKPFLNPAKLYLWGERAGSEELKALAALIERGGKTKGPLEPPLKLSGVSAPLLGPLMRLFRVPPELPETKVLHKPFYWLPNVQHLFAHQFRDPDRGFALAAKAGHNAESHNHNDVGQFIVFYNGKPFIIDVGRETYTRKTFSSGRYELWFTRGNAHNVPVVNGIEQKAGAGYRATNVKFHHIEGETRLSMNLERAYPFEARLKQLRRVITLRRLPTPSVTVSDSFVVENSCDDISISFYTPSFVKENSQGVLELNSGGTKLSLSFWPCLLKYKIESKKITDPLLSKNWGSHLNRITFHLSTSSDYAEWKFTFQPEGK